MIPVSRPNAKIAAAGTLGFASALPFVFLTGTLAGWFSELGISMTMIGLLSSITLAYAFKLLQAPLVRRGLHCWMALRQFCLVAPFAGLAQRQSYRTTSTNGNRRRIASWRFWIRAGLVLTDRQCQRMAAQRSN